MTASPRPGGGFSGGGPASPRVHVLRVPPERLDAFEEAIVDRAGNPKEGPGEHERFRYEMGRWDVVGYNTGKVTLSTDELVPVVEEVLEEVLAPAEATVVGSDEAGKGEWRGPLVVAACAVAPDERAPLVARGVMDSKELSSARVTGVADVVEQRQTDHAVVLVGPSRFNELYAELEAEGKGLNDLVAWAHASALGEVLGDLEDAGRADDVRVVVDAFDRVRTAARSRRAFDVDRYPLEQVQGGEDEVAVAAASVLAKAARERWLDRYEDREGVDVRELSRDEAREHPDRDRFAKVDYL